MESQEKDVGQRNPWILPSDRLISTFCPQHSRSWKSGDAINTSQAVIKSNLVEREICLLFEQVEFEIEWKSHVEIFGKQLGM